MKREKKGCISYDGYIDAIASGAATLESSESDAIMHRIKTQGQARKVLKASLISALQKSHEESISQLKEAASAARALKSMEERNCWLQQKNQDLPDRVRGARVEVRVSGLLGGGLMHWPRRYTNNWNSLEIHFKRSWRRGLLKWKQVRR